MPPFRDDQIFIIAPGSQTTLAQLGLPESFTPARFRFRSCMFEAEKKGEYEAIKIRRKIKQAQPPVASPAPVQLPLNTAAGENADPASDAAKPPPAEEEDEWEEDRITEEGAIWPVQSGRIVDWPAFYALMTHVYNSINPPFHTPIMLIAEPAWTSKDREKLTQFFFEKFKIPAFTILDSALASSYAYGVQNAVVVDVGLDKTDVTCIADFVLQNIGRSIALSDCGGKAMTKRLQDLLRDRKDFTEDVCEQLKKSTICEVLLSDSEIPTTDVSVPEIVGNPAAIASTGQDGAVPGQSKPSIQGDIPGGPGPNTEVGDERKVEDEDGVLDIASIVTSNNLTEIIAQKEKEKQEKKQQKKGADLQAQNLAKAARLPNSKRARNTFIYEGRGPQPAAATPGNKVAATDAQFPTSAVAAEPATESQPIAASTTSSYRRELEVGTERFQSASGGVLTQIADAVHRTILSCSETGKRSELWESLVVVGNGAKVRGFKEALVHTLSSKYLISPSSATIFTSELPSNLTTPVATGTNTPQALGPGQHHSSSVNPLLIAATTAQNPALQSISVMSQMQGHHSHSGHGQTPTSIKLAKIPDYFPEWKEAGYEEAHFLGAQVAAKVLFITDGGASKGYMTRTDYNDQGPIGIHEVCM